MKPGTVPGYIDRSTVGTSKNLCHFRAQQTASGMRGPEQMMEVWTSETGDWTMVVTYATGTSCIVAMG